MINLDKATFRVTEDLEFPHLRSQYSLTSITTAKINVDKREMLRSGQPDLLPRLKSVLWEVVYGEPKELATQIVRYAKLMDPHFPEAKHLLDLATKLHSLLQAPK